ncbi:AtpZ/AtpI family protein [uncultured Ferrovibrio sp.]|jgi:ATP synthase protein I|uniref:AtpZ/AtpI family protein n=1 Tax=uncultured Ferrovibrio sp. TaxID=1576913 RepID=UPI00260751FC|nr:AtpZ/AtpI family protein [uncultured Ferrovibrio sp.]
MADQDHPPKPEDGPPRSDADALARLGRDLETVRERKAAENAKRRPDADPRSMRQVGKAWSLAIEMVAAVVVSLFIGWWVDRWFDTAPWGLLGFILLGVAAALWSAIRTAMLMQAQQQADNAAEAAGKNKERD